jgi:hypothetical protein
MMTLAETLERKCSDVHLRVLIIEVMGAVVDIAKSLRTSLITSTSTLNHFGDVQLSIDLIGGIIEWTESQRRQTYNLM